jgi:nucleoid-associated protein YgaU
MVFEVMVFEVIVFEVTVFAPEAVVWAPAWPGMATAANPNRPTPTAAAAARNLRFPAENRIREVLPVAPFGTRSRDPPDDERAVNV